ncbi:MAG: SDR family NAD(P)-dependent oxidoreductase [Rhodospirillales bacterium]|nr:SDR family NAD(P)-dependent oxidoreductase [Rhodospirillales bacterium]
MSGVLITGASSGIGRALAVDYAAPGVHLFLGGRDEARLEAVAAQCRAKGARVAIQAQDVAEAQAMRAWVLACDDAHPLDWVIANAGISAGTHKGPEESAEQMRRLFAVNVEGTLNTILPALERMRTRGRGGVALMSSLAGFRGFPQAPAYAASKAAIRVLGEALAARHRPDGIRVSVICPGFVKTPMTDANRFRMPLLMTAERAAVIIRKGLEGGRGRIAFPLPMLALVWLLAALPDRLAGWLSRRRP